MQIWSRFQDCCSCSQGTKCYQDITSVRVRHCVTLLEPCGARPRSKSHTGPRFRRLSFGAFVRRFSCEAAESAFRSASALRAAGGRDGVWTSHLPPRDQATVQSPLWSILGSFGSEGPSEEEVQARPWRSTSVDFFQAGGRIPRGLDSDP